MHSENTPLVNAMVCRYGIFLPLINNKLWILALSLSKKKKFNQKSLI